MPNRTIVFIALIFIANLTTGQDLERAKSNIDTLCSPAYHGRGYTHEGDKKATKFILQQFLSVGLDTLPQGAFQPFQLDVNTLEGEQRLQVGNKTLRLGVDFIVGAQTHSAEGTARLFRIGENLLTDNDEKNRIIKEDLSKKAIILSQALFYKTLQSSRPLLTMLLSAQALLLTTPKLTHSVGREQWPKSFFIVDEKIANGMKEGSKVKFRTSAEFVKGYTTQNVIGWVKGVEHPDSFLVVTAHYDHLGDMGSVYFAGANDNASGVATMIELAHHFAKNPSKFSMVFIAFGAEEAGLVGSKYFVQHPYFPLSNIKFLLNLDLFATGELSATVVNATEFPASFDAMASINEQKRWLSDLKKRGPSANSDHHPFYVDGVPSFFVYLMGDWPHYHDIDDRPPVPLSAFEESYKLMRDFLLSF